MAVVRSQLLTWLMDKLQLRRLLKPDQRLPVAEAIRSLRVLLLLRMAATTLTRVAVATADLRLPRTLTLEARSRRVRAVAVAKATRATVEVARTTASRTKTPGSTSITTWRDPSTKR